ncbi:MAG: hypothetical protein LQ348_001253 [Seirophora lacunosa]|nr:MAG: hypothetical protein LQ348_001253 [Seirophora lacunosa]
MQNTPEDISNQASGHKANLSNPNTSEASKAHSKEVLESLGGDKAFYGDEEQNVSKNPNQVAGGLKAAINNDNVTQSGKAEAQEKLDNM